MTTATRTQPTSLQLWAITLIYMALAVGGVIPFVLIAAYAVLG
jgi:hypothetical protein